MKIHHVGIAVRSLDAAAACYEGLFKVEKGARYELPEFGVSALFIPIGESSLEFLEPIDEDSTVAKFIEKRGEGIHHICFEVDDIIESLAEFERSGVELIDRVPRPGAGGHLVAFLHPRSAHGVLVELKQR